MSLRAPDIVGRRCIHSVTDVYHDRDVAKAPIGRSTGGIEDPSWGWFVRSLYHRIGTLSPSAAGGIGRLRASSRDSARGPQGIGNAARRLPRGAATTGSGNAAMRSPKPACRMSRLYETGSVAARKAGQPRVAKEATAS